MKYFVKLLNSYVAKNKAHADIQEYARQKDGTLLNSDEARKQFRKDFEAELDRVNTTNKRCHDIEFSGYQPHERIAVDGNFAMTIFPVKHEL